MKGASSLETDFFNGEIVMLGRLHGVPTPTNEFLQHYAARMLRGELRAGSVTTDQFDADWQAWLT
jgi:2-dehydropantoate 2-reductase